MTDCALRSKIKKGVVGAMDKRNEQKGSEREEKYGNKRHGQ